ncbi:hypothetical protein HME9302_01832 [Alteripontixanthobacter maritimus]|uniref:Regulatory protein RecX n=1 Tax=Alteripontixanthobacter maritimus TaxID=2161824 RepID=A0A369QEA7_9SPHN|nr:regulatory protein RecX [Alteripontixanthobacter maritimus]RDC60618.1 hypothetical protein HME9302_01832 [Alteripontixanthobacter maritimus]
MTFGKPSGKPSKKYGERREKRPPKPLDPTSLRDLALSYVARFSTSSHKLEQYLQRKLRERGWSEDAEEQPDTAALAQKYVELGYIDDEAYARAKSGGLLRRGYGARRVSQALHQAGIDEAIREEVSPGEAARREAALVLARKRRFGPFGPTVDRPMREKHLARMIRAGHGFDTARAVLDAPTEAAAEEWAAQAYLDE